MKEAYTFTVTSATLGPPTSDLGCGTSDNPVGAVDDTTMFICLASSFNPLNSLAGLMYAQDDIVWSGDYYSNSNDFKSQITTGVATAVEGYTVDEFSAGTTYTLVLTSYQSGVTGTINVEISCPGSVAVPINHYTSGYGTVPTMATASVSTFTATTATLGGNVTADGGASVTGRSVVYSSTDATPTIGEDGVTQDTNDSGTSPFSESVNGLTANTTYYVRAYATNTTGTSYGDTVSLTTSTLYWKDDAASGFAGGSGTSSDPYLISTAGQLAYFSNQVNAGTNYSGKYFKLTTDFNLSGKLWTPIGNSEGTDEKGWPFHGIFDGDGHVVTSMNATVSASGSDLLLAGLFGFMNYDGIIKNLGVTGTAAADMTGSADYAIAGGLVADNFGAITNRYSQVTVSSSTNKTAFAGGLWEAA